MATISGKSTRRQGACRLLATVLMAGGMVVYAGAAQAGFEFSAPPKAPAAVATAPDAVPSMPAGDVDMAPLPDAAPAKPSNVNISAFPMKANAPASPATAPVGASALALPSAEPRPVPGTPVPVPDGRHAMTAPSMTPPPPAVSTPAISAPAMAAPAPARHAGETGFATVSGFGSDMPLVLAMRQIVPATYAYSFDPSTNPGTRISWEGGRPWNVVLNDALEPYGLKAAIVGQAVRVMPASAAAPADSSKTPALTIMSGAAPAAEPTPSYPPRVPHKTFASNGMMPMSGPASLPQASADKTMVYPAPTAIMAGTASDETQQSYPHRQPHRAMAADAPAPVPPPALAQQNDMAPPVMPLAPAFAPPPPPAAQSVQAKAPPSWFYYSGQHRDAVKAAASDDGMMTPPVAPPPAPAGAPSMAAPMAAPVTVPMAAPMPILPPSGPLPAPPLVSQEMSAATPAAPAMAPPVSLSAADSAAVIPAAGVQTASHPYNAETGQSLKMVLEQWSQQAGVELAWTSITDYNLPRPVHTTGTFADAVKDALMAYQNDPERPIGTLHTNTSNGAPVLEIKSYAAAAGST